MTRVGPLLGLLFALSATGAGCASHKNASFNVSNDEAQRVLKDMRTDPKPLDRPLVVLAGFCDPGVATTRLTKEFRRLTGDRRVIGVTFLWCGDFDACRKQVIDAVDRAFPSDDPAWTTEVDVIGVSMGGLVGRYAAIAPAPEPDARRLRISRLFTIGTPHRGASMAMLPTLHQLQIDMRADSRFLRRLDAAESTDEMTPGYKLLPYVRLGDTIVGAANSAPLGVTPYWVPGEPFQDSHMMAIMDVRIIADMARRLRGESPLAQDPPQPLPGDDADDDAAGRDETSPPTGKESHAFHRPVPAHPRGTAFAIR